MKPETSSHFMCVTKKRFVNRVSIWFLLLLVPVSKVAAQTDFSWSFSLGQSQNRYGKVLIISNFNPDGSNYGQIEVDIGPFWHSSYKTSLGLILKKKLEVNLGLSFNEESFGYRPSIDSEIFVGMPQGLTNGFVRSNVAVEVGASYNLVSILKQKRNPIRFWTGINLRFQTVYADDYDSDVSRYNKRFDWSIHQEMMLLLEQDFRRNHLTLLWQNKVQWRWLFFQYDLDVFAQRYITVATGIDGTKINLNRHNDLRASFNRWSVGVQLNVSELKRQMKN